MIILIIDINGKMSREIGNWQMENMVLKKNFRQMNAIAKSAEYNEVC